MALRGFLQLRGTIPLPPSQLHLAYGFLVPLRRASGVVLSLCGLRLLLRLRFLFRLSKADSRAVDGDSLA